MAEKKRLDIRKRLAESVLLKNYQNRMRKNGLNVPLPTWFSMVIGGALALSFVAFFFFSIIHIDNPSMLSVILFLVVMDLGIGYPLFMEMRRLEAVERALPDALKQIADTLRAGGTYEFALRELASSDYGPLTAEIKMVLRKLDEGENMENSLRSLGEENNSKLIKRSITIIIDALKTGAALSDVLDQISDDVRALRRIALERKSRTIMGVMLIVAAGAIVAPALFGLNGAVLDFLIKTTIRTNIAEIAKQTTGSTSTVAEAITTQGFLGFLLVYYIFLELVAASVMISLMRDGKINNSIIYAPALLLIGFVIYYGVRLLAAVSILSGG